MIFILKVTLTEYFSQGPQNDIYLNFIHSQNLSVLNLLNRNPNRTVIYNTSCIHEYRYIYTKIYSNSQLQHFHQA